MSTFDHQERETRHIPVEGISDGWIAGGSEK